MKRSIGARRIGVRRAILVSMVAILGLALPAAAAGEPQAATSSHGSQARCRYEATQIGRFGWTEADLRRIVVTAPTIYGTRRGQTVGWRFVVQRSIDRGPWRVTYRSPIQKATAGPSRAALFTRMGVDVAVPKPPAGADWDAFRVHYRVVLKTFWYRADGTIQARGSHLFDDHRHYVDGVFEFTDEFCRGEIRQFFDGPTG